MRAHAYLIGTWRPTSNGMTGGRTQQNYLGTQNGRIDERKTMNTQPRPTPKTDALRDLYENHEYRATVGDIWELCEFFERELNEARGQLDRLAASLRECREDSAELLAECGCD